MRHPRQEGHHHAQGHPAGQEDPRREGLGSSLPPRDPLTPTGPFQGHYTHQLREYVLNVSGFSFFSSSKKVFYCFQRKSHICIVPPECDELEVRKEILGADAQGQGYVHIFHSEEGAHTHTHICIYVLGQVDFHLFLDNPILFSWKSLQDMFYINIFHFTPKWFDY